MADPSVWRRLQHPSSNVYTLKIDIVHVQKKIVLTLIPNQSLHVITLEEPQRGTTRRQLSPMKSSGGRGSSPAPAWRCVFKSLIQIAHPNRSIAHCAAPRAAEPKAQSSTRLRFRLHLRPRIFPDAWDTLARRPVRHAGTAGSSTRGWSR